jgi:hypothetical protein
VAQAMTLKKATYTVATHVSCLKNTNDALVYTILKLINIFVSKVLDLEKNICFSVSLSQSKQHFPSKSRKKPEESSSLNWSLSFWFERVAKKIVKVLF